MIEPNKPELKLAMAKLLPEMLIIYTQGNANSIVWANSDKPVLETEWLFVMQMVEKGLNPAQKMQYTELLAEDGGLIDYGYYPGDEVPAWDKIAEIVTSYFNQRATAMCKVKGIQFS